MRAKLPLGASAIHWRQEHTVIDLHNHILPGVDDGAASLEESIAIARQFQEEGVVQIAATPHYDASRRTGPHAADVRRLVAEVQAGVSAAGIPLTIVPGQELYLTPDAVDLLVSDVVSPLGSGPYVLVELSLSAPEKPAYLNDALFRLQVAGYKPILAHPERYAFVQRDPDEAEAILERGAELQLTAPAYLGERGRTVRRTAEKLLRLGLYSLASSDRHHPGPRRSLATLADQLRAAGGEDLENLLLRENPTRVLAGEPLLAAEPLDEEQPSLLGRLLHPRAATVDEG